MTLFFLLWVWIAQSVTPLTEPANWLESPALSPDGKTLVLWWATKDFKKSGLFLRPVEGGDLIPFAGDLGPGTPSNPKWSPDGTKIAFQGNYCHHCNDKLFVKDYPQGSERELGEVCKSAVSWTPDGRYLAAAEPLNDEEENCRVTLIPVDGGARIFLANDGDVASVSPDGKRIAYAAGNQLKLATLADDRHFDRAPVTIATEPHAISSIQWTPDGKAVVYQVWSSPYWYSKLLAIDGGAVRLINPGTSATIEQILPNGDMLATEALRNASLWRTDPNAAILNLVKVRDIPWTDDELRVSPDGNLVAFETNRSGPTQIWISKLDGSEARVLVAAIPPFEEYGDRTMVGEMSWSPDGKLLCVTTGPGVGGGVNDIKLYLVPTTGGPLRELVDEASSDFTGPRWSADGRFLFINREDDNQDDHYFRVDISTGQQTPVANSEVPPRPGSLIPLPSGSTGAHLAGQVLFFEQHEESKSRVVLIHKLLDP